MIIVNDGSNCPFNATGAVTDTAWLKLANTGLLSIKAAQAVLNLMVVIKGRPTGDKDEGEGKKTI